MTDHKTEEYEEYLGVDLRLTADERGAQSAINSALLTLITRMVHRAVWCVLKGDTPYPQTVSLQIVDNQIKSRLLMSSDPETGYLDDDGQFKKWSDMIVTGHTLPEKAILEMRALYLELPVNTLNALEIGLRRGPGWMLTVEDLISHTEHELRGIKGIGKSSIAKIKAALARYGLSLRPE